MRKILAILSAFAIITAVSCSNNSTSEQAEQVTPQNYTAEKLSNVANYSKENMKIPENCNQIWTFMPYNQSNDYLLLGSGSKSPEFWHTSDFENYDIIEFPEFDIGRNYSLDTADDGTVVTFVVHADYGDLPPISAYEYPEDYDEQLYDENAEYSFMIKTYSKDGSLVSSAVVDDFGVVPDKMTSINSVCSDGQTVVAMISGAYEMFTVDGKYIGELVTDMGDIDTIGKNRDGKLICSVAYTEEEKDKLKICYINADGTLTDCNNTIYDFEETPQGIQQGTGEYDFFLWSRSTIFGIKSGTAEIVPLFNINVSGMTSDNIQGFTLTEDNNIAVISNDYSSWSVNFKKYLPRTKEEMEGIPVLTFGVIGDGEWEANEFINPWNDEGHEFILELKSYNIEVDENGLAHFDTLQEDIISGNLPDIMLTDETVGEINLAKMGALCDLYEFMDKDEVFNRDYFVPNVLECLETDGALYSLPNRFCIDVGRVAKTKFVSDDSDWDFDKYLDMIINPPIDIEIKYDSKKQRLGMFSYTDWIDPETYTCNYTDGSFVKYLEWCNIPEQSEPDYPDWEDMTEEEDRNNYMLEQRKYIDDKSIFSSFSWLTYENYVQDTRGQFNGEEITYLDTPHIEGFDNIAITANSENKELAWEYIKSRISDESYEMPENGFHSPFPITKTGLKYYENFERKNYTDYTKFDETKDDPEWKDYKGIVYQLQFSIYEDCIKCGEITDEDVQAVNDMIARAEPSVKNYIPVGFDFYRIIDEEVEIFLNGDCTAEQCAENVQSRASIYLSEKFG